MFGWINVKDRLPEEPYGCLVTVLDSKQNGGEDFPNILPYFVGWDGEQWNDENGERCPFEVIAWMKLPEPYQPYERKRERKCKNCKWFDELETHGIGIAWCKKPNKEGATATLWTCEDWEEKD